MSEPAWRTGGGPVRLPWGMGELELGLPADWAVYQAQPAAPEPSGAALADLVAAQLQSPLGAPPLRQIVRQLRADNPHRPLRVAIVVDDNTRATPAEQVLPVVLEHLGVGRLIDDASVEIHFAGGMHSPMTPAQMAQKIGADLAGRFACFNNPWQDPSQYRHLGRTRHNTPVYLSARVADADLRVLVGSVAAHLQAGFSGGMKLLFPGLASLATIKKLHLRGTEAFRQLVGLPSRFNPMRQEIDRLSEFLDGVTFSVQLLMDGQRVVAVSAGDVVASQRELARRAAGRFGTAVPGPADVLVTNSNPLDYDLWQGFKCIANTLFAARPGGVIIATIKADHGTDGMKLPAWTLSRRAIRRLLAVTGRDGLISLLGRLLPQVNDEAKFFVRFCLGTISRNHVLIYSPTLAAEGARFPGLEVYDDLSAVWDRAGRLLGLARPSVTVFARGGACYPLLGSTGR